MQRGREIVGSFRPRFGHAFEKNTLDALAGLEMELLSADAERTARAANLCADRQIACLDAFALELAIDSLDSVLVTADYQFKPVSGLAKVEFPSAQ